MGVKALLRVLPAKGSPSPAQHDVLVRLIEEVCVSQQSGRASEAWGVTCALMKQGHGQGPGGGAPGGASGHPTLKDTWVVSFKDAPDYVYLLNRPDHQVMECEASMMRLLERKLEYGNKMTVRFEGRTYSKGDFLLRLCTATQALASTQGFLGHCIELEYLPVCHPAVADPMMNEMYGLMKEHLATIITQQQQQATSQGLQPPVALMLDKTNPSYDKYGLGGLPYGRTHVSVAYADLIVGMLTTAQKELYQQQQQMMMQQQQAHLQQQQQQHQHQQQEQQLLAQG